MNGWKDIDTCPICRKPEDARPILVWHAFQGAMISDTGRARENRFHLRWQEIPEGWIDVRDRKPTRRDADNHGCVLIQNRWEEPFMLGWHLLWDGQHGHFAKWQPPPGPPGEGREARQ